MQPVIFSQKHFREKNIKWYRGGYDITYKKNNILREKIKRTKTYHTLTFSYNFQYDNDVVYFAQSFPYTYSQLMEYLKSIQLDPKRNVHFSQSLLIKTIAKNKCNKITITSREGTSEDRKSRIGIMIMAR